MGLYQFAKDRAETTNLAAEHPEHVMELSIAYEAWAKRAQVLPWPIPGGSNPRPLN
ncbi:MAG: hypothetical protein WEB53_15485 [Akkermansiaceae bacterium]